METKVLKRLPVGIQTYEKPVNNNCLYVDKTEYIYKMINPGSYVFLSRPIRFGKIVVLWYATASQANQSRVKGLTNRTCRTSIPNDLAKGREAWGLTLLTLHLNK